MSVRTKRDRQLRRHGAIAVVLLDLVVLFVSVAFILAAAVAARGFGGG